MKFSDFASIVACSLEQLQYSNSQEKVQVGVEINVVGVVGGTPIAKVDNAFLGFDWDRNKFIIKTSVPLRETTRDEIKQIREQYDELGNSLRTIRELKRENKKLKEELVKLKQ